MSYLTNIENKKVAKQIPDRYWKHKGEEVATWQILIEKKIIDKQLPDKYWKHKGAKADTWLILKTQCRYVTNIANKKVGKQLLDKFWKHKRGGTDLNIEKRKLPIHLLVKYYLPAMPKGSAHTFFWPILATNGGAAAPDTMLATQLCSRWVLPQSNQQHKTKQNKLVGVALLSVKNHHHTTTTTTTPHRTDYILSHFQAT
jgi:hypothetical protein